MQYHLKNLLVNNALQYRLTAMPDSAPQSKAGFSDRERFVAFAFCWADVLVELDGEQNIVYAGGTTHALTGKKAGQLMGTPFTDLVADSDKILAGELIAVAARKGRIENTSIRLNNSVGATQPLALAGYRLDDFGGHFFLALRSGATAAIGADGSAYSRNAESGLYDAEGFAQLAEKRLNASKEAGEGADMTLVALPEMAGLKERLDEDNRRTLTNTFSAALRANSIGGDSAAEIEDGKYAIIHEADLDIAELQNHLTEVTRQADPEGKGAAAEVATISTDDGIGGDDLANGLVYAINKFRDTKGADFSLENFSTNLNSLVGQAMNSVKSFKEILAGAKFDVAFHPILNIASRRIHHYEALVRFHASAKGASPYEYITFAEEVGLIWQFDIAMAKKVINWLSKNRDKKYSVAINISGHSITNLSYLAELHGLLKTNFWARGKVLFEITESARIADLASANRFFQTLRGEGYEVCLDDFGAGAASFQYLSNLDVDVVKLDGSAVKNALVANKGRAFLSALARLCKDIGVETVAEMIDDQETLDFVRKCGIDYAQGYFFGKPSTEITDFDHLNGRAGVEWGT
tara:strand:+ start:1603 stop:3342 length:1740 start_codon:yes stop_codon:yes gene_type:complete